MEVDQQVYTWKAEMYEITYHCLFEPLHGASKWAEVLDTNKRVPGRWALSQGLFTYAGVGCNHKRQIRSGEWEPQRMRVW